MTRYVSAECMDRDDFGVAFTGCENELVYDAQTIFCSWATMTHRSWQTYGRGRLGLGLGQCYRRDSSGQLWKVQG